MFDKMEFNLNGYVAIFSISLALLVIYPCIFLEMTNLLTESDIKEATSKYKYPPGPRGVPILGVGPLIPPVNPGPTVSKWAEQYGEMMTLQLGGMRWVFLNSSRVAREILERRSGVCVTK